MGLKYILFTEDAGPEYVPMDGYVSTDGLPVSHEKPHSYGRSLLYELRKCVDGLDARVKCPAPTMRGLNFADTGPMIIDYQCHYGTRTVADVIIHLNDAHEWTREDIADWLESLDVDLTFHEPREPEHMQKAVDQAIEALQKAVDQAIEAVQKAPGFGEETFQDTDEDGTIGQVTDNGFTWAKTTEEEPPPVEELSQETLEAIGEADWKSYVEYDSKDSDLHFQVWEDETHNQGDED